MLEMLQIMTILFTAILNICRLIFWRFQHCRFLLLMFAVALIPLLYLMRRAITAYLGAERAQQLRLQAAAD